MNEDMHLPTGVDTRNFEILPKLKNEYNFQLWNLSFRNALTAEGTVYIEILDGIFKRPQGPKFHETTDEAVNRRIIASQMDEEEIQDYDTFESNYDVPDKDFKTCLDQFNESNNVLLKTHEKKLSNWRCMRARLLCFVSACVDDNPKIMIIGIEDPVEAYNTLVRHYGKVSHQGGAELWRQFSNMNYKGSDAASFVRRFREARWKYEQAIVKIPCPIIYAQFMEAIIRNPGCSHFIHNFTLDEDILTEDSINKMFDDFVLRFSA